MDFPEIIPIKQEDGGVAKIHHEKFTRGRRRDQGCR